MAVATPTKRRLKEWRLRFVKATDDGRFLWMVKDRAGAQVALLNLPPGADDGRKVASLMAGGSRTLAALEGLIRTLESGADITQAMRDAKAAVQSARGIS